MTPEQNKANVFKGMWGVVNGGGTGAGIKINGFDIAGKTGTAQVAKLGAGRRRKERPLVVCQSFAPAYKPELAVIALIENSGFGGSHAAPAVKGVYEAYITKHHSDLLSEQEIAKK
ncbi:MAG: penicillin-binding transpeptidase domain-containing protein [Pyrinomonadaceae bacterium]